MKLHSKAALAAIGLVSAMVLAGCGGSAGGGSSSAPNVNPDKPSASQDSGTRPGK